MAHHINFQHISFKHFAELKSKDVEVLKNEACKHECHFTNIQKEFFLEMMNQIRFLSPKSKMRSNETTKLRQALTFIKNKSQSTILIIHTCCRQKIIHQSKFTIFLLIPSEIIASFDTFQLNTFL